MGCYFLTLSLMSSIGAPIGLLGIILPIYTIIDMIETAENVLALDPSVCAMVDHDLQGKLDDSSGDAYCLNSKVLNSRGKEKRKKYIII